MAPKPLPKGYPPSVDTLGLALRRWRMDRGISQAKLAGLLGVSKSTIENWELRETEPRCDRLPAIKAILGRPVQDLGARLAGALRATERPSD